MGKNADAIELYKQLRDKYPNMKVATRQINIFTAWVLNQNDFSTKPNKGNTSLNKGTSN